MEVSEDRDLQSQANLGTEHVLRSSTGNAQLLPKKRKLDHSLDHRAGVYQSLKHDLPPPRATLRSNDRHALIKQKLNSRKLKRRFTLVQTCLQHDGLVRYLTRSRMDTHKDNGDTLWPPELEKAFQNAIINIPFMGRKKKAQRGKPCGRNELISEWIFRETGKERDRKRISSHIQVYGTALKTCPEWTSLTKIQDADMTDTEIYEYYHNSIEDMVRNWQFIRSGLWQKNTDYILSDVKFKMWVGLREKLSEAIHLYSQVPNDYTAEQTIPLESIPGWRVEWPDLVPIIDNLLPEDRLEIIELKADLSLMLEFPPPTSKLGIHVELEMVKQGEEGEEKAGNSSWSCVSSFYQRGEVVAHNKHENCQRPNSSGIMVPFESGWWAKTFVQLTEKRQKAQISGNTAAIAAADESARNYLHDLKVVQQISQFSSQQHLSRDFWSEGTTECKPAIILLWSFSPAATTGTSTTGWRKLIPPPNRVAINSPLAFPAKFMLPALSLDSSIAAMAGVGTLSTDRELPGQSIEPTGDGVFVGMPEDLYQDRLMLQVQHDKHKHSDETYGNLPDLEYLPPGGRDVLDLEPHSPTQTASVSYEIQQIPTYAQQPISNDLLEVQEEDQQLLVLHSNDYDLYSYHELPVLHHRRQPLLSFDIRTHRMLQAQLGSTINGEQLRDGPASVLEISNAITPSAIEEQEVQDSDYSSHPRHRTKFPQTRCTGWVNRNANADFSVERHSEDHDRPTINDSSLIMPTAIRPPLLQHHSFAGVLRGDHHINDMFIDVPQSGIDSTLDTFRDLRGSELSYISYRASLNECFEEDITRPRSQPPPIVRLNEQLRYVEVALPDMDNTGQAGKVSQAEHKTATVDWPPQSSE